MQQQQIELVRAAAGEGFLGGHAQVSGVFRRRLRGGEAGVTLRACAFALVKIMAHRADETIGIARQTRQRAAQHFIGRVLIKRSSLSGSPKCM